LRSVAVSEEDFKAIYPAVSTVCRRRNEVLYGDQPA
jgi:hypothetical protein